MHEFLGAAFEFVLDCIFNIIPDILIEMMNRHFNQDKEEDNDETEE